VDPTSIAYGNGKPGRARRSVVQRIAQSTGAATARAPRGGGWLRVLLVLLVVSGLVVGAALWALNKLGSLSVFRSSGCTLTSPGGGIGLDLEQAQNASTIAAVGVAQNVPAFGIEVAEATAMQESKLHNIGYGDRDSVGLFQQRPSQGWGTAAQILDPVYATTRFYQALEQIPGWQQMQLTEAAQAVQHSGSPTAYAQHEQSASVVASVFTGTAGGALGCTLDGPTFPAQPKGSKLLTARGQTVVDDLRAQFGAQNVGKISGIGADGLSFGVTALSPGGGAASERMWAYANWAVAQAETLGIAKVSYGGKTWSAADGSSGWKADSGASAADGTVHIVMVTGS
jgi:hypothetical protein